MRAGLGGVLGGIRGMCVCAVASVAALALAAAPAGASAASPVLEFVPSSSSFPIPFEAEGGSVNAKLGGYDRIMECTHAEGTGEITGARTTLSSYVFSGCTARPISGPGSPVKCSSAGAGEEEIRSATIEADLVYLDQANHEVAVLLNPGGGIYMEFDCEGALIKASGPFLSPVGPVNQLAASFTAVLERNGNSQTIDEYEDLSGVKHQAIPMAEVNAEPPDTSGVELAFTIRPSVPLQIKAVSTAEVETKQHEEEAASKKRQEEEAAALTAKTHQEEVEAKARRQKLTKALRQCKKVKSKGKRTRCRKRATKKYGRLHAFQRAR